LAVLCAANPKGLRAIAILRRAGTDPSGVYGEVMEWNEEERRGIGLVPLRKR